MRLLWSWLVLVLALVGVGSRPAMADASATADPSCFRGLSADGSSGLFDQPSANPGCSWRLRTGSYLGGFVENGFLLVGDRFRSMGGGVAVAATLGQHIELALQLGAQLGRIESPSTSAEPVPESSLLAISQFKLQLKLHSAWGRLVHVALMPTVRLPGAGQDFSPVPLNLDAAIDALLELNLRRALPQLPLTLPVQLGYVHDRSLRALDAQDCMGGTVADWLPIRWVCLGCGCRLGRSYPYMSGDRCGWCRRLAIGSRRSSAIPIRCCWRCSACSRRRQCKMVAFSSG